MRLPRYAFTFLVAAVCISLLQARDASGASDPAVVASFQETIAFVQSIPDSDLNRGGKTSFAQRLSNAQRLYEQGQVCAAANILQAHLNESQAARRGRALAVAEELYDRGRALRDMLLRSATPPDPCFDASIGRRPMVQILVSDNKQFGAHVTFGSPSMWTVQAGGETWTQMSLPGIDNLIGAPGFPGIPSWQALIGVPNGASPRLPAVQTTVREQLMLNLYPFQNQAADPTAVEFGDPPFIKDEKLYQTSRLLPGDPCAVRIIGVLRDLTIAQIQCNAAQYNPFTDQMTFFDSVDFTVQFDGGSGDFVTSQSLSVFEPASNMMSSVLNASVVSKYVRQIDPLPFRCLGEELLILTAPAFHSAADDLATWKNSKGIVTRVVDAGGGSSLATGAQIDAYIESQYNNCWVRPSYVLLLGDSEFLPPARTDYNTLAACVGCGDSTNGSDWGYATLAAGTMPSFAVGRMPVNTLDEANRVVQKTIGYESTPPFFGILGGGPFYTTSTNASFFQCCRTDVAQAGRDMRSFAQTSETARDALVSAGYNVQRIYNTNTGYATDPVADATPRRYYDGTSLPAALAPGTFTWNGSTTDIINAINQGRFLVLHRDHGAPNGWGDPPFSTGNLASLTNGTSLPFVYSVDCASGFWDKETDGSAGESFMEQMLLLSSGGMVGGLGDNRNSPSWANSALTRGFYDATWPNVAPAFGDSSSKRRLGDILNHGKLYLYSQIGVAQPVGAIDAAAVTGEFVMWHAFGDPTAEMWTSNPYRIDLSRFYELAVAENSIVIHYGTDQAILTAFQMSKDGIVPIARGTVSGGVATLPFFQKPDPQQPILLSASLANAVSVFLSDGTLPDLIVRQISLPSTTIVAGQDLFGPLKVLVKNQGGSTARGTMNLDGTPRPAGTGYMVDLVLSSNTTMPFGFATVPLPAGVAYVEDGLLQGGRISRTLDVGPGAIVDTQNAVSGGPGGIVPLQAPLGKQFLCARIDPGDAVVESNELNNVTCIEVTVVSPLR